jgi:hypothetical protein
MESGGGVAGGVAGGIVGCVGCRECSLTQIERLWNHVPVDLESRNTSSGCHRGRYAMTQLQRSGKTRPCHKREGGGGMPTAVQNRIPPPK